ncbi:uncharacterized protein UV8b_00565 [Ustilaginoidea virens]|uniref:Uncharacterized protein n=1 Tax=Ustilaginoidea virens TaxID=1159556 RepID=A0A8E5HIZ0_USTVR|nr:uncharacterized protein UV8b_00565 [Ustilaginoidea virens]QUC16324.1 hypothetical protein UV8b_00565 [Ustilaginoidea virens]
MTRRVGAPGFPAVGHRFTDSSRDATPRPSPGWGVAALYEKRYPVGAFSFLPPSNQLSTHCTLRDEGFFIPRKKRWNSRGCGFHSHSAGLAGLALRGEGVLAVA